MFYSSINVKAVSGCCSWHGGEVGCSGNNTLCADGTVSSCSCDGTNSSSNYYSSNNNSSNSYNKDNNSVGIVGVIIGFLIFLGFAYIIGLASDSHEKHKKIRKERKKAYEQKIKEDHINEIQEQKEEDFEYIIENIENDEEIEEYIDNIDDETITRYTRDDLIEMVNSNSEYIFRFLDMIYENFSKYPYSSVEEAILSNFCFKILNKDKLTSLENKCIKYLLDNEMINSHEYILLEALKKQHTTLIKYLINNCNNKIFEYKNYGNLEMFFNYLLELNDLNLIKKIAIKKNFKLDYDIKLLKNTSSINEENRYLFFSTLYKNYDYLSISVCNMIEDEIDFKDDNSILSKIDEYSVMTKFLDDNAYYLIYLLIKKNKTAHIEYLLSKSANINLNNRIDGITPLIYACYRKSYRVVELLLNYGVDVNYSDINGNIALEYACNLENLKICKLLIEKGCLLKDDSNNQCIERAIKRKNVSYLPKLYISKLYDLKKK
jgi:hypothetical protein